MTKTEALLLNYVYSHIGIEEAISTKFLYPRASEALDMSKRNVSRHMRSLLKQDYVSIVTKTGSTVFYRVTAEGARHRTDFCKKKANNRTIAANGNCAYCNKQSKLMFFKGQYICASCLRGEDKPLSLEDYIYKQEGIFL